MSCARLSTGHRHDEFLKVTDGVVPKNQAIPVMLDEYRTRKQVDV